MKRCFVVLLLFVFLTWNVQCARILFVFPIPSYSHYQLGFRMAKELAERGHQVTSINPYPQKTPIKNYKDVSVEEIEAFFEDLKKNYLE
jgi:glucuronosyltransferase